MNDVTRILNDMQEGDSAASERLLPMVYDELRKLAAARLAQEKPGQTLQATALVHDAYLKLVGGAHQTDDWNSRGHFFGAAAEAMRRILIDQARHKKTQKAGGDLNRIEFSQVDKPAQEKSLDLLALDEALRKLERAYPRKAELVKLRYFAGLTIQQAATALNIATSTADADWAYAKGFLKVEMLKG